MGERDQVKLSAAADAQAQFAKALAFQQAGRLNEAADLYQAILAIDPGQTDALHLLGLVALQTGSPERAIELISQAIAQNPGFVLAHSNLGAALLAVGRHGDALVALGRALAIQPDLPDALNNRSSALAGLGRLDKALADLDRALALQPAHLDALINKGSVLVRLERFTVAAEHYELAIQTFPNNADLALGYGVALEKSGRLEDALKQMQRATALRPDYAETYNNLGGALQALKRAAEALASYDRAIAIKPDYAEAYSNRGVALQELKRLEEALASYDRAIAIKPGYAEAYSNRGNALRELNRLEEALASYDRAIAIKPDYAEAYWNKSLGLLLAGDLGRGWELYEWRWKYEKTARKSRNFPQPLWLGEEDIDGKTILLHAEQGLGDTIQFCRYAKLVKALGAKVILEAPKELLGLLNSLEGVDELMEQGKALPAFDFHCPLLSLPLAFKTDLTKIPSPKPYLAASSQKLDEWAQRLGAKSRPRVGLVWSGRTTHKNDHNRSLTLQQLLPHLPDCCEYVSLQKDVREVDKSALEASGIKHYVEDLEDFTDAAALCDLMDLVISVDTSVGHLAGAIGKTTWILLPYSPDWRWLLNRNDSPWYESMKLYRQDETREWPLVLRRMRSDMEI